MKKKFIEASEIPEDDKVYLIKDWMGWKVISPWKDPETGKINWFNLLLGGKRNAVFVLIVIIITLLIYFGVNELIAQYKDIAAEPCKYCASCFADNMNLQNVNFKGR